MVLREMVTGMYQAGAGGYRVAWFRSLRMAGHAVAGDFHTGQTRMGGWRKPSCLAMLSAKAERPGEVGNPYTRAA